MEMKRLTAAALSLLLAFLPLSGMTAGASERAVSQITTEYEDGTQDVTRYEYNEDGNRTVYDARYRDGSTYSARYFYDQNGVSSGSTVSEYDAAQGTQLLTEIDYAPEGHVSHQKQTLNYSDGTWESSESWFADWFSPLKQISVSADGSTQQTDYTYDSSGLLTSVDTSSTTGSWRRQEYEYDENGITIRSSDSSYNALTGITSTSQLWTEDGGPAASIRSVETSRDLSGNETRTESWNRKSDNQPVKVISTAGGVSTVEEYSYDGDGELSYYIKRDCSTGRTIASTTVTKFNGMEETTSTDEMGNTTVTKISSQAGIYSFYRQTESADGASEITEYAKKENGQTEGYGVPLRYYWEKRGTDGSTQTSETIYADDGSYTVTSREADGTVTVEAYTSDDMPLSETVTRPDGAAINSTWELDSRGYPSKKTTVSSDGSLDGTTVYEYDEYGILLSAAETRSDGRSSHVQYTETYDPESDIYRYETAVTFSTGASVSLVEDESWETYSSRVTITYGTGDIASEMVEDDDSGDTEICRYQITYRDGRTEETILAGYLDYMERKQEIRDRMDDYMETGWDFVSTPAEVSVPN